MTTPAELFPTEQVQSLSPRLRWMRNHRISTRKNPNLSDDEEPFEAWIGDFEEAVLDVAEHGEYSKLLKPGSTIHDALVRLAKANGWRLWNEETAGVEQ